MILRFGKGPLLGVTAGLAANADVARVREHHGLMSRRGRREAAVRVSDSVVRLPASAVRHAVVGSVGAQGRHVQARQ